MSSILKQELLDKIAATDDENLLQHIKEEIDYLTAEGKTNVLDELSTEDRRELETLLKEPFGHETESYIDFKKATQRWRTR
ncbi:MAG TPA: hypothetical protein VF700_03855 [Segetibacter sp.]